MARKNIFVISAATGEGIEKLKDFLVDNYSPKSLESENVEIVDTENNELKVYNFKENTDTRKVKVEHLGEYKFRASGERLEQIIRMTDFENNEAVMRVYDVLEKMMVIKEIEKQLEDIMSDEEKNNNFFFEGSDDSEFRPKILIAHKEIDLDKLKYNL